MTETEVKGRKRESQKMSIRQMIDTFKVYKRIIIVPTREKRETREKEYSRK